MFQKAKRYFSGATSSPQERRLLFKLDIFILTFCCLAYFVNYLDRANVTQAYVSGMEEELNFHGAQYTVVTSLYQAGYMVGIIPNNLLLTRFKPRVFFPLMMIIWSGICMINAAAKKPQDMMVIRFFQGYFESCIFAGTHLVLGSWYKEHELGWRTAIFTSSGLAGGMFGGFLQTGIHESMNGLHGLSGWRWLFIIDGVITIPIAIYGYFFFPDTPATTTARYLSEEEKMLAIARVPVAEEQQTFDIGFFYRAMKSWYVYGFGILWVLANCSEAFSSQSLLNLYMQAHPTITFTVAQRNNYPTGVQAIGIISTLLWATYTDIYGHRYITGFHNAIVGICTSIIILAPSTTTVGVFAAYYWAGTIYCCQATFFAWANDSTRNKSPALRAFIIGFMNFGGNSFQVWWSLVFYRADAAPMFTLGMYCMIVVSVLLGLWTGVVMWLEKKEKRKESILEGLDASSASAKNIDEEALEATGSVKKM